MDTTPSLTGRVVVVTGAASGLGRAFAEECARLGASVALLDRDAERLAEAAQLLAEAHGVATLDLAVDVADAASVDAAATAVVDAWGRVDVVISNVGVQLFGGVDRLTDDEWRWVLDVNVIGAARTARAFLPHLRASDGARLAFTASSSVLSAAAGMVAYQTSKFALWGLAESLRCELGDAVPVTLVVPSGMLTRHFESSGEAQPAHIDRPVATDADLEVMFASNAGMGSTLASPEDAAAAVLPAILAGEPYAITHGDLVAAVDARWTALHAAAERAR